MARLTMDHITREHHNRDAAAVTSLQLSHRALSDVSLLSSFGNLERLDLSSNCLCSLEGLSSCGNLKWLSVVENKLISLRGIEGLQKLTVLNAGKNKLEKFDEVTSLPSLRALILNDNCISSICRLDQLKYLNTLVLSRNPIQEIRDALVDVKSIRKLSLSYCQIDVIGSSLMGCLDLKELRLAHNKIMALPIELGQNMKIQNLDLGNNLIEKWSDLKVLSALHKLKNLNLQGNPVAEKDKLANKIRKLMPHLRILNGKPIERVNVREKSFPEKDISNNSNDDHPSLHDSGGFGTKKRRKAKNSETDVKLSGRNIPKILSEGEAAVLPISTTDEGEKELLKMGSKIRKKDLNQNVTIQANDEGKVKAAKKTKRKIADGGINHEVEGDTRRQKMKNTIAKDLKETTQAADLKTTKVSIREQANSQQKKANALDDAETPFLDVVFLDNISLSSEGKKKDYEIVPGARSSVVDHAKKKKKNATATKSGRLALQFLPPASHVGMGGPSTWDD